MVFEIFNVYILVEAIWLVLPAYAANGLVPILARCRKKKLHRLDFGRKFIDGKDIFGPGKSIEGLLFGSIVGIIIAMVEYLAFPYLPWSLSEIPLTIVPMSAGLGFLLGFGSLAGDSVGSFIKRRLNLKRGQKAPLLDQLDFLIGALAFSALIIQLKPEWIILLVVLTPILHFTACCIGYLLKVKKEPW